MDALLGSGCVNEVCNALKSQPAKDAVACTKKTQVASENVGRGGECKSKQQLLSSQLVSDTHSIGLTLLPGIAPVT